MTLIQRNILIAMVVLPLLVGAVIAVHNVFTEPTPGMNDFMSRWEGARSFFEDGVSPYSETANLNIQERIYGRAVIDNEDPGFFVYPFYTAFIVGPTVPFDYAWASAIWMVVLATCLIVALFLLLDFYAWRPSPIVLGALMLWALMDYFASRGLFLGQPSHVVYVLQVLTLWALFRRSDELAGIVLAVSTFKPQMGYLFVPLLLLWGLRVRRFTFVGAFVGAFGVLMLASFALQPDWFGDWIDQVRAYPDYTAAAYPDTGSPVWIVMQHYLGTGDVGEWIVNLLLLAPVMWAWYGLLIENRQERLLWTVALTLVVGHMVALRTATPHFVIFNIMIIYYLKRISGVRGGLAAIAVIVALFVFSWAQFAITVQGRASLEHPSLFLPLPISMLVLLWTTRERWWSEFAPQMAEHVDAVRVAGQLERA